MTLDKNFDPAAIEARWYAHWEKSGQFRPERGDAEPFTIVNPPPNVTGSLHIGHALDNTLQDIIIRHERLKGKDALWVVGMDHAGIATQMVVERQMEERQDKRTNYTREEFVEKVWEWKEESGGAITGQLRRLGCSMDWSNERFTMDDGMNAAVLKVFVDLYKDGLIYRDKRLVNWDPALKTAISDLEVETVDTKGSFWHFKYPLADGVTLDHPDFRGQDYIEVATTRPETMLADMAVAVHPSDERYQSVIGKEIEQPITGRRFKVVADEHADPELGSGAVKITPGHDFNDFEVGKRAGFAASEMLNMLDGEANVCQSADGLIPEEFIGLHRFKKDGVDGARELVVQRMKELDCLIPHVTKNKDGETQEHDAEPRTIATPFGDRGGVVIEPWLTDQWYVDAETLAQPAIKAVRDGSIEIVPKTWEKTWFNWMENIQPWCVSRQLWWGHRIPAWFGPTIEDGVAQQNNEKIFVGGSEEEIIREARAYYPDKYEIAIDGIPDGISADFVNLTRDPDVLDTWFSSALWPFGTLGWPEDMVEGGAHPEPVEGSNTGLRQAQPERSLVPRPGSDLERHYPNDLLISGFDILFFWDARMAMQGIQFMKDVPWKRLYLHGLVRAEDGSKMSKSKGNVVDPLGLIDQYGADALRFFMAAMESQGRDIKMDDKRVEGYRNFATKLWNASRFCEVNGIGASQTLRAPEAKLPVNRWIISEVSETLATLDKALGDLRFDAAANTIYHFTWDRFCDWYLELIKPILSQAEKPSPLQGRGLGEGETHDASDTPLSPALSPEGEREVDETRAVAGWVLDQIIVMLHPFMPFITEELWHSMASETGGRNYDLIVAKWPEPKAEIDADAKAEVDWLIHLITQLRSNRTEMNVSPGVRTDLIVHNDQKFDGEEVVDGQRVDLVEKFRNFGNMISRLGRVDVVEFALTGTAFQLASGEDIDRTKYDSGKSAAFQLIVDNVTYSVPLDGVIDIDAEKARLGKALEGVSKEAKSLQGRLGNANFVEKAKPEAVEKARADLADKTAEAERLQAALDRLG
ncbi:valine--tRNA ligase [Parasphingorhabdus cellanae]|uniref:Valine--tRNA ligase n=1 Tax=Parasphingorhabdus cellanae TaxID=2806553 RepID=A0ABX7T5J5_9SPHN|nr:valine--tRNA ligase [Parasphingorhabdus cellanae]QTD56869.1 valine--tRNA ligase [Parasphingorhabdus cellanae]